MRFLLAIAICLPLAFASQIGLLHFFDVVDNGDFANALGKDGKLFIFFHAPGCLGCEYMEKEVFASPIVAKALEGYRLMAVDVSKVKIFDVPAVVDNALIVYEGRVFKYDKVERTRIPILGTPTVIAGEVVRGEFHAKLIIVGPVDARALAEYLNPPRVRPEGITPFSIAPMVLSFLLGMASVISPCVIPILTVGAVTLFARRNLGKVLLGMVISFAAVSTLVGFLSDLVGGVSAVLKGIGGIVLIIMGLFLIISKLNLYLVKTASVIQTRAARIAGAGDLALGVSLGVVWTPCIAPFVGSAATIAILTGNLIFGFATMLAYGMGLAIAVYIILRTSSRWGSRIATRKSSQLAKWGKRLEMAVGYAAVLLGALLLGDALGLGTWGTLFGWLEDLI